MSDSVVPIVLFYPPPFTTGRRVQFLSATHVGLSDCPSAGPSPKTLLPHYVFDLERSKVKVKDVKMPKSFLGRNYRLQMVRFTRTLSKDQNVQIPGAGCMLCLAL